MGLSVLRNVHWVLVSLLLTAATATAQLPADWSSVTALPSGTEVRITFAKSNVVTGKLESVTDNSANVDGGKGPQAIEREQITQVSVRTNPRSKRNVLIGLGVGMGGAAAGEAAIESACGSFCVHTRAGYKAAFIAGGLAFGAAVGAAIGAALSHSGWREIYRQQARQTFHRVP